MDKAAIAKDLSELVDNLYFVHGPELNDSEAAKVTKASDLTRDIVDTDLASYLLAHKNVLKLDERTVKFLEIAAKCDVDQFEDFLVFIEGKHSKPVQEIAAKYRHVLSMEYKRINNVLRHLEDYRKEAVSQQNVLSRRIIQKLGLEGIIHLENWRWDQRGTVSFFTPNNFEMHDLGVDMKISPSGKLETKYGVRIGTKLRYDTSKQKLCVDILKKLCGDSVDYISTPNHITCRTSDLETAKKIYAVDMKELDELVGTHQFKLAEEIIKRGFLEEPKPGELDVIERYGNKAARTSAMDKHLKMRKEYERLVGCLAEQLV